MLAVPEVVAVNVDVQVADAVVPDSVHVVKVPVTPVSPNVTVPVGVLVAPVVVSVTVTLQVEPWFATTGVVHEIEVDVAIGFTTMLADPLLELWAESPG